MLFTCSPVDVQSFTSPHTIWGSTPSPNALTIVGATSIHYNTLELLCIYSVT